MLNGLRLFFLALAIPFFVLVFLGEDRDIPPDEPERDND